MWAIKSQHPQSVACVVGKTKHTQDFIENVEF